MTKLQSTKNYNRFEMHELNRPLGNKPYLEDSMVQHGFMPSSPIHCIENGNGKLKVIRGHHRLHYAKRLGLPVYFVVDESNIDIAQLEGDRSQGWSNMDFVHSFAKAGKYDYIFLLDFKNRHKIPLSIAASLVGGECAGSHNKLNEIKTGNFKVARNLDHATSVMQIVRICHDLGVLFARASAFISAVSLVLHVNEFNENSFVRRIKTNPARLTKRSTMKEYISEIEAVYNHGSRSPIPLAFLADEAAKKRKSTSVR